MRFKQILGSAVALLISFGFIGNALADQLPQVDGSKEVQKYFVGFEGKSVAAQFSEFPREENTRMTASGRKRLDVRAPAVQSYREELRRNHDAHIAEMESILGRQLDNVARLEYVMNGIAVELTAAEADQLRDLEFVRFVELEEPMILHTDEGPAFIGAPSIWDGSATPSANPNRGEGMVLGMLDSGVNWQHPSFDPVAEDGYEHNNPLGSGNFIGFCASPDPDFECNDKLIGAHTFVGGDPDDTGGHGSHTASTAGGNEIAGPFVATIGIVNPPIPGVEFDVPGLSGVASRANLINYKVCATTSCTSLPEAVDQAVADGVVDAINFSIGPGSGQGQDPWVPYQRTMLDAVNAGIFVAASAGNTSAGVPDPIANVANKAPWIMTVANSTHRRAFGLETSVTGPGTPPDELVGMLAQAGSTTAPGADVTAPVVYAGHVDAGNFEGCNAWTGTPFEDSIALISRGNCTFADKINNAEAAGAEAVIIYNHEGALPAGMDTTGATLTAVSIGLLSGQALISYIDSEGSATAEIESEQGNLYPDVYPSILSGGSLTGPNLQFDITAPDITAPGSVILAANTSLGSDDYHAISGTSMSSPHVAGAALLVMKEHPDWTVQEVKSALMMTADPETYDTGGIDFGSPDEVGSGMTDLTKAAQSGLVMHETFDNFVDADPDVGGDPATLNIPSMRRNSCGTSCSWTRTVRGALDEESSWTVSTSGDMDVSVNPAEFELLSGDVIRRGGFESDAGAVSSFQTLEIEVDNVPSGTDFSFGEIVLSEDGEQAPDARMTISVRQ